MKTRLATLVLLTAVSAFAGDQPNVRVEPANLSGPGHLQEQTEKAVIGDYLESWKTFRSAFEQNRPDLLDRDFVGSAKDKLASAIREQNTLGIHTRYRDRSHDIQSVVLFP